MQTLFNALILSVTEIFYLVGVLIAVGTLLGWIQSISNKWAYQAFGKIGILLTGFIGTPIHEAGHAIMCLLFGHKINSIKFFTMSPNTTTLGYVNHSFNKHNLYQASGNFFISLGPLFSGTTAILFFMYLLEPSTFNALQRYVITAPLAHNTILSLIEWSGRSMAVVYTGICSSKNVGSPSFWLFLVLTICTASHIALSKEDIKNAISGLVVTLFTVVIINMVAVFGEIETLKYVLIVAKYNIYLISVLSVAIGFSLITAFIMGLAYKIKSLMMR
ncbi:MAG: hypothetical protein H6Q70_3301 [Firmicutes bacterium]|nr:hypothetical protein [Bacillota bacterium]